MSVHTFEKRIKQAQGTLEPYPTQTLIYGPTGSGKTTFLGSAGYDPRTSPILVLDFERGGKSLQGADPNNVVDVWVRDWEDFNEAYDYLSNAKHPYQSVAIDSITETHIYSILEIVSTVVTEGLEKRPRALRDISVEQADYGKSMTQIRRLLRYMKVLPIHFFCCAQDAVEVEPGVGVVKKPYMFGKLASEVTGMFDIVAYLSPVDRKNSNYQTIGTDHVLVLGGNANIRTKVRMPWDTELQEDELIVGKTTGVTQLFDLLGVPDKPEE